MRSTTGEKEEIVKKSEFYDVSDIIDKSYYRNLVDAAIETISEHGDAEMFLSDDPYVSAEPKVNMPDFMNIPEDAPEEIPFEEDPLPWN